MTAAARRIRGALGACVVTAALAAPAAADDALIVGDWSCVGESLQGASRVGYALDITYAADETAQSSGVITYLEGANELKLFVEASGGWRIAGDFLIETSYAFDVTRATVDGRDVPPEDFGGGQSAERPPSRARIQELTASQLVLSTPDIDTLTCSRR